MLKYPRFPAIAAARRRRILPPLAASALVGSMMLVLFALGSITPTASAEPHCNRPDPPPICDPGGDEDLPPGPPLSHDADFISQSELPRSVPAGQGLQVSITMRNVGNFTWLPGTFKLGSQSPQDNLTWGISRVDLPAPVEPGQSTNLWLSITAPRERGVYTFQWQMLEEHARWFGDATPAKTVTVEPHVWSLRYDMMPREEPSGPGPLPDRYGNHGTWSFRGAPNAGDFNSSTSRPLDQMTFSVAGFDSLACRRRIPSDDSLPIVCQNWRIDNPQPFGIDWPPGTVLMHPGGLTNAIVGWRSPYYETVRIEGSVTDLHAACGDGIEWSIWLNGVRQISGVVRNGAPTMRFSDAPDAHILDAFHVGQGDIIYLGIDSGGRDNGCDSTGVEMIISQGA